MPDIRLHLMLLIALGIVGWAICGATILVGRQLVSMDTTLAVHAIVAPLVFGLITSQYFRRFPASSPAAVAFALLGVVMGMDLFVVAALFERSYAMFQSILGTWIPFASIATASYLVGRAMRNRPTTSPRRTAWIVIALLVAAIQGTGCASALSAATRHEIAAGVGVVGSDESAQDAVWTMNDGFEWTADYAFRVCDRCETFRLFVDIPLLVIPHQGVLTADVAVPDARRDVYVIPNARFSVLLFEKASLFVGGGGGIGHFTESARMTTGEANANAKRSTRAVVGVHGGAEAQLTKALGIRFGLWAAGPRPELSFPMRRGADCTRHCGDTTFSYLFSTVYHF